MGAFLKNRSGIVPAGNTMVGCPRFSALPWPGTLTQAAPEASPRREGGHRTRLPGAAVIIVALFLMGNPGGAAQPQSAEPYAWRNVVIGGGGFVTGIITHPRQRNLMYARTDVGGAYRWDDAAQRWIPLTDGIGDMDFTGIESLAVDPADTNRVYLAAGIYSRGKAAILRSADQGRTWLQTDVPFKMGGNEAGRFNGERLAVDPNDGNILFFGSRRDGLWKSADRGATWQKADRFRTLASAKPR